MSDERTSCAKAMLCATNNLLDTLLDLKQSNVVRCRPGCEESCAVPGSLTDGYGLVRLVGLPHHFAMTR